MPIREITGPREPPSEQAHSDKRDIQSQPITHDIYNNQNYTASDSTHSEHCISHHIFSHPTLYSEKEREQYALAEKTREGVGRHPR